MHTLAAMARNVTLLCYKSCPLVCLGAILVVLTSSVELCFRLISPVDCPCLYRLEVHKSCDFRVPRCVLCSPHFPNMGDKPQNGRHVARESTFLCGLPE